MPGLRLCLSRPHPCQYLSGRTAAMLFGDPEEPMHGELYSRLCAEGFRRSGDLVYRPACPRCQDCVAVRVPIERFRPRRRQARCRQRNADLQAEPGEAHLESQDGLLLKRYLHRRHQEGGMDGMSAEALAEFLESSWCPTSFVRFYLAGELVAVIVLDVLTDGLSAVYSFYSPEHDRRGLGNFCVLWSIDWASRLQKKWLYLGYWIGSCRKMSYKAGYLPQQRLLGQRWVEVEG